MAASSKDPEFVKLKNTRLLKFNKEEIQLESTAVFYNPNKAKLKLREIYIDVYIDDTYLTTIDQTKVSKIKKKRTFEIPLHIKVKPENKLASLVSKALKALVTNQVKLRYEGFVKVSAYGIPVKVRLKEIEYVKVMGN